MRKPAPAIVIPRHVADLVSDLGFREMTARLGERERQQEQADELRGEGLGGGDTNLRTGVEIDRPIRITRRRPSIRRRSTNRPNLNRRRNRRPPCQPASNRS